jgi:hypothetical protein
MDFSEMHFNGARTATLYYLFVPWSCWNTRQTGLDTLF